MLLGDHLPLNRAAVHGLHGSPNDRRRRGTGDGRERSQIRHQAVHLDCGQVERGHARGRLSGAQESRQLGVVPRPQLRHDVRLSLAAGRVATMAAGAARFVRQFSRVGRPGFQAPAAKTTLKQRRGSCRMPQVYPNYAGSTMKLCGPASGTFNDKTFNVSGCARRRRRCHDGQWNHHAPSSCFYARGLTAGWTWNRFAEDPATIGGYGHDRRNRRLGHGRGHRL